MLRSTLITFGILVIITSLLFTGYVTYAQSPLIVGGFIVNSFYCACSGNFLLTLSPPTPGQWIWNPSTPQFSNFQLPRAGVWTVGNFSPGGICMVPGTPCTPFGTPIGTISPIVGTSF